MKKTRILTGLSLVVCLVVALAACGGDSSSSAPASTPPASTPASMPASTPADSSAPAGDDSTGGEAADTARLDSIASQLTEAADIETPLDMMELDLKAGGVPVDDILGFVGVTSQNYSDNGGLVMVIQAKPGMAASVEAGVESFKASRQDDRYTEFATQVANTKEGRVRTSGDIVVLAVSASGDWDKLDAALDAALA